MRQATSDETRQATGIAWSSHLTLDQGVNQGVNSQPRSQSAKGGQGKRKARYLMDLVMYVHTIPYYV
jgi:hypothetical protein